MLGDNVGVEFSSKKDHTSENPWCSVFLVVGEMPHTGVHGSCTLACSHHSLHDLLKDRRQSTRN